MYDCLGSPAPPRVNVLSIIPKFYITSLARGTKFLCNLMKPQLKSLTREDNFRRISQLVQQSKQLFTSDHEQPRADVART